MKKENKILYWFIGTFLLPPVTWLLSAWYFEVWNTEEMMKVLFRINIPAYVIVVATIIFFIVKRKIKVISNYYQNPTKETLIKAQKSARFIPIFFLIILPIYTTLGDFPVLLPLDFIDKIEFMLGISIGIPIVFLFAIPFFLKMNTHLEEFTKDIPFSDKYKPLSISNKMTVIFLLSIIGIGVFYISAIMGISHNNVSENIEMVYLEKLVVTSVIILFLSFLNLRLFKKQVLSPINEIKQNMQEIAEGNRDLTKRIKIKARDELGELSHWFNLFMDNMTKIITEINKISLYVNNAGTTLASMSEEISGRANEQASTTEGVASAMEEMVTTINSNTEKAEYTEKISSKSAEASKNNNQILQQTIKSISEISEKISIISEIADKTDILSINAAIEAARAGEQGKGFAVVANEIRKLADKTKIASEEIENLSKSGRDISSIAGKALEKLIPQILNSAELVNNIVIASQEQSRNVENINNSIQQLTDITNENSASAEEMSSSAEELSAQAKQLKDLISIFKIENTEQKYNTTE